MAKKSEARLGKGLAAIFGEDVSDVLEDIQQGKSDTHVSGRFEVPVDQVRPNPYQPRKTFDEQRLKELAQSIQQHGVFTPILVKKSVGGYELIAGERRLRASKMAGLENIPAIEMEFDDQQMMEIALLENIQREDLNVIEEAKAYEKMIGKLGYTQEELAIKLNVTRQTISKWEKGLSVPDVDFLFKIADVLETNVGTLLGGAIMDEVNKDTVAEQLAKISEQLAIKNRRSKRIWKIVGIVLLTILALNLLLAIFGMSAYTSFSTDGKTTVIEMNEDSVSYEE